MSDVRVVDVSNYQGAVQWPRVLASGVAGGIVKATEGLSYRDPTFTRNWTALSPTDVFRGAYHFARPERSDGPTQAAFFLAFVTAAGPVTPRDVLVLDVEVGDEPLSAWALAFLQTIERATGVLPWVYSYGPFLRAHLTDPALARYPLWLAAYQSKAPATPAPWKAWRLWQRTSSASIPGINGNVDESIGTIPDPPSPTPAPPPAPTQTEVSGVRVDATSIPVAALDDQGRGWVSIPAPISRILFLAAQGSAPGRDKGYWPPVTWDVNDSGPETIVTLYGQPREATRLYYSVLAEE